VVLGSIRGKRLGFAGQRCDQRLDGRQERSPVDRKRARDAAVGILIDKSHGDVLMKCFLCDSEAVAVFEFPEGCICRDEQVQPLCAQHAFKATPRRGMLLIEDLTEGAEFTQAWLGHRPSTLI
jgi:hypothetical protein